MDEQNKGDKVLEDESKERVEDEMEEKKSGR